MIEWDWTLPMFADSDALGVTSRQLTTEYLTALVSVAEGRYDALLLGTGFSQTIEATVAAGLLLDRTSTLKALIAVRPGLYHPLFISKVLSSLEQLYGPRVLLNLVAGGVPSDMAKYGDSTDHAARYRRLEEFIDIVRGAARPGATYTQAGAFYGAHDAGVVSVPPHGLAGRIYLGGSSDEAFEIAARTADTYLTWGETVEAVAEKATEVERRAARHGRTVRVGVRINVIARPTSEQAWEEVRNVERVHRAKRSTMVAVAAETDSVGQRRMFELSDRQSDDPVLWTGLARYRVGSGTALVGSYGDVADALLRYRDAGAETFVLSSTPQLEESVRVADEVLSRCDR